MGPRKFLLVTKALTTAGLLAACKKDELPPPPGNPKGSVYNQPDATPPDPLPLPGNPKGSHYDEAPPPSASATPRVIPPPGNPKGSHFDAGLAPTKPKPKP